MKKILSTLAIACSLFASTATFAQMKGSGQEAATNKGDMIFDFGIGLIGNENSYNNSSNYNNNNVSKFQLPTFSLALQKAFWDDITIGGQLSFNAGSQKYEDYNNYYYNNTYHKSVKNSQFNTFVTARGEYHFNRLIGLNPKCDLYAGALVGVRITNYTNSYEEYNYYNNPQVTSNKSTGTDVAPVIGPFGGFRYYFGKNIAVYGEVGFAITAVRGGLAWKF